MVIIGTGGLAVDMIGNIIISDRFTRYYFYNDRSDFEGTVFLNEYVVYRNLNQLQDHFKSIDNRFVVAIANPLLRMKMTNKIMAIGGVPTTFVSTREIVSRYVEIGKGSIIQPGTIISGNSIVGEGCFFNCLCIIGHDVKIGSFCSFGPGVRVLGGVEIGEFSYIGCNAIIAPGVKIGKKVRIGMAKVITEDVPDNSKII